MDPLTADHIILTLTIVMPAIYGCTLLASLFMDVKRDDLSHQPVRSQENKRKKRN
ncbi:hypothetical protein [Parendozoicomonas sp. Alg238-R29]|uniref:hypothetical protein n=1 Tax=Parendozoicomonas sp. Alg238-R29 TaxID=2993446 RepID=UPI00248EFDEB|nr:hypothetical protein [Parendozoicomonas sp. Alg238-R29]